MIVHSDEINQYLDDFYNGRISMGLGIDVPYLDNKLRYKQGQFNVILGLPNVGKTDWAIWYFWKLSQKHGLTHIAWTGENKAGTSVRRLIQYKTGKYINQMSLSEVYRHSTEIQQYFKFVSNKGFYTPQQLFDLFRSSKTHNCFIDPFTGLNKKHEWASNMDFLNDCRNHCSQTNQTIYLSQHPNAEGQRRILNKGEYSGYIDSPMPSHAEGGAGFFNRADDFIVVHRYVGHPIMGKITQIGIRKIKENETGGEPTDIAAPLDFDFNNGLGYKEWGASPLANEPNLNGLHKGGYATQPEEEPPF